MNQDQQGKMSHVQRTRRLRSSRQVRLGASLGLALGLATLAPSAQPSHAAAALPFGGIFSGQVSATFVPPNQVELTANDTGTGTYVGHAVLSKTALVTLSRLPCGTGGLQATSSETATLRAADGSTLDMGGSVIACHSEAGTTASGSFTVTGGSGRFAGTTGQLTESISESASGFETATLRGWISSPGSNL